MIDIVRSTVSHNGLLEKGDSVIVALSGGADSVTLLHILLALKDEFSLTVYAAHLNHNLRGEESYRDENFVTELCRDWGVELFKKSENVSKRAKELGISDELCGRNLRYEFFAELSEKLCAKVATAHTLSDCEETMLYNISRGTSLHGLCSIPAKRGNIIRPLIDLNRKDIEEYISAHGLDYVEDSTNAMEEICKRNKIRNVGELEDLLNILSSAIGSLTNPEKLRNTFKTVKKSKITPKTIKKYLDCFEDSFLIESAQRYDIKGKAYIETPKKYYFSDLGLRNARINFRQFEQTHAMENVIYNELCMRGYSVDVGVIQTSERAQDGKQIRKQLEVDFVCNLGSSRYYVQSAYSLPDEAKRTQEIRPFRKIDDSFKKIVVTKDIVPAHYDEYGILTVNIYDFLLDPECLVK